MFMENYVFKVNVFIQEVDNHMFYVLHNGQIL